VSAIRDTRFGIGRTVPAIRDTRVRLVVLVYCQARATPNDRLRPNAAMTVDYRVGQRDRTLLPKDIVSELDEQYRTTQLYGAAASRDEKKIISQLRVDHQRYLVTLCQSCKDSYPCHLE
jgi:hypothetical protein